MKMEEDFGDFSFEWCYLSSLFSFMSVIGIEWPTSSTLLSDPCTHTRCPSQRVIIRLYPEGRALGVGDGPLASLFQMLC